MSILDAAMADGKLDPNEMAGVRANLAQYLKEGYNANEGRSLYQLVSDAGASLMTDTYTVLWSKVRDGEITAEEAAQLVEGNDANQIARLYDKLNAKGLTVKGDVAGTLYNTLSSQGMEQLKGLGVEPEFLTMNSADRQRYFETLIKGKNPSESLDLIKGKIIDLNYNKQMLQNYLNRTTNPVQRQQAQVMLDVINDLLDRSRYAEERAKKKIEEEKNKNKPKTPETYVDNVGIVRYVDNGMPVRDEDGNIVRADRG
jgi:hypothetical protein